MTTAFVALGSNLGQPRQQLIDALACLDQLHDVHVQTCSSFYRSKPVGPQDQPDFVNAVAWLETTLAPLALLDQMQAIETRQGRIRGGQHWGPRTLDLDLLLYGEEEITTERLHVPHPELQHRDFVLIPLAEIAPNLVIPRLGPLSALVSRFTPVGLERLT